MTPPVSQIRDQTAQRLTFGWCQWLLGALAMLSCWTHTADAQLLIQTRWIDPASDFWREASNWNNGLPTSSRNAIINNGGTAVVSGSSPHVARELWVGAVENKGRGELVIDQATLTLRSAQIGTGDGDEGVVTLQGGQLTTTHGIVLGSHGDLQVQGTATIQGDLQNSGELTIGSPVNPARLTLQGNYLQTSEGILRVYATPTPSSQPLQIAGKASLGGTMIVSFPPGTQITNDFSVTVISTTQGIDGAFDNFAVEQPPPQTQICVDQIDGQFVLTYKSGTSILGDYHRDGVINARDVDAFIQYLTEPARYLEKYLLGPIENGGDLDSNGVVDFYDADEFAVILEACEDCGDIAALVVPEPVDLTGIVGVVATWQSLQRRALRRSRACQGRS